MDEALKSIIYTALESVKKCCDEIDDCSKCPFFIKVKSNGYDMEICMFDTMIVGAIPHTWNTKALKS